MSLYLRYFQDETLVKTADEAIAFLQSIPDIHLDQYIINEIRDYAEGPMTYTKRVKVKGKSYFLIIKAEADTLEEFRQKGEAKRLESQGRQMERREKADTFETEQVGWYDATIHFKRVVTMPVTQKFQYCDTTFRVRLKAVSVQDCYNRVIDHLRSRGDIDPRSQFPSIRKKDFSCRFLGMNPDAE